MSEANLCVIPILKQIKQEKPEAIHDSSDSVTVLVKREIDDNIMNGSDTQNNVGFKDNKMKNELLFKGNNQHIYDHNQDHVKYENVNNNVIIKEEHDSDKYVYVEIIENKNIEELKFTSIKKTYDSVENIFKCKSDDLTSLSIKLENNRFIDSNTNTENKNNINNDFEQCELNIINEESKKIRCNAKNMIEAAEQQNKDTQNPEISDVETTSDIKISQIRNVDSTFSAQNIVIHNKTSFLNVDVSQYQDVLGLANVSKKKSLIRDLKQKTNNKRQHCCIICGKAFNNSNHLKTHSRIHTGEKPYSCNVCGKAFNQLFNLKTHEKIHTDEKTYSCNVCGIAFHQLSNLKAHNRIHTGETPYSCDVCGKAFNKSSHLKEHNKIHTGEKPYPCNVCGKAFSNPSRLKKHNRVHTGETPYSCNVCGKSFSQFINLKTHNRIHTEEKPYSCNICEKTFNQSSHLNTHYRKHTGETRYSCNICGKAFNQSSDLKKHYIKHTGETPFTCNECGKAFSQSSFLKRHIRLHTGETPFSCNVCGKVFIQSSDLKRHHKTHTGETPFSCKVCQQKFKHKKSLVKHLQKHIQLIV